MPSLTLKNIPPAVHLRLKRRAARSRRSLSQEAIACLEHAVMAEPVPVDELLATARRLRRGVRGRIGEAQLEADIAAGRP
jgi:plasmid stability protein